MKLSKKGILRGTLTAMGFHLVAWGLVIFLNYVGMIAFSMFYACIAGLVLIPVYFKVMGENTAGFGSAFLVFHVVLSLIAWLLISNTSEAVWNVLIPVDSMLKTAGYFYSCLVIFIEGCISPAINGVICLVKKRTKEREA